MKKQKRQLLIMLLALVVLGGGYFGLRQYNKVQSEKVEESDETVLVTLEKEDIIRFTYDYNDVVYTFEKNDDTWYYADQPDWNLTQYRLTNIASKLAALTPKETITGVTDLSQYGLDDPAKTVTFETETDSYTFYAGDYNDIISVYYICMAGDDSTVYTVSAAYVTVFNLNPEDIIEEEEEETTEEAGDTAESEQDETESAEDATETQQDEAESVEETAEETAEAE